MTSQTYDKAKWHYDRNFPSDLSTDQGSVHIGMFLGWLIDRQLTSPEFTSDHQDDVKQFVDRRMTGPQVLRRSGELLAPDMLNASGNSFTTEYYETYMDDYFDELGCHENSLYHVKDSWENYAKICRVIEGRFNDWKTKNLP